jgi:hypothetical protein
VWVVGAALTVAATGLVTAATEAAVERALDSAVVRSELEAAAAARRAATLGGGMALAYWVVGLEVAGAAAHIAHRNHRNQFQWHNQCIHSNRRDHPHKSRWSHRRVYGPHIHWNKSIQEQAGLACCARNLR